MDAIVPTPGDAVVSCHVEAPLDDRVWRLFSELHEARPGGFRIAALMRPPHHGEDEARWIERAREAARRGPLGHHTHFARPDGAWPERADDVERPAREAEWLAANGIKPTLFCGGAWYMDLEVAETAARYGYADCTGLAFRPSYFGQGRTYLHVPAPTWLVLPSGTRLLELPSTHSVGLLARAVFRHFDAPLVHAYFHDTDLLDPRRRTLLGFALRLLARRRRATDLDLVRAQIPADAELGYEEAVRG
jgi:hypothetical protein